MSDFVEWNPKHHGHKPLHWTPDMLTSVDGKNFVRQTNWAWIAGSTYYVPHEAVHGVPRPAPVDADADAGSVDDYQRGVLDERARCAALADGITDIYAGDECGRTIANAIRAALEKQP